MSLRNSITAPIAAVLLTCGMTLPAAAESYRDAANHFSVELPPGWHLMPAQEVQQINEAVRQRMPGSNIHYEAGFRPVDGGPGTFPYVLVQLQQGKTAGSSYEEIERSLTRELNSSIKDVEGSISDLAKNVSLNSGGLDRTRNRVLIRMQMDVAGVGKVQGFTIGHIGSEGVVFLHCYAPEKDVAALLPTYDRLSESFRFDPGYTFTPGPGFWGKVLRSAAIYGIIGGIVGSLAGVVGYLLRKKSQPKSDAPEAV